MGSLLLFCFVSSFLVTVRKTFRDSNHHAEVLSIRDVAGAVPPEPLAAGFLDTGNDLGLKLDRKVLPEVEVAFKRGL